MCHPERRREAPKSKDLTTRETLPYTPGSTDWYVIQVRTGQERRVCELLQAACAEHNKLAAPGAGITLEECFSPKFKGQKKWKGSWRDVEYPLLPGYVVAVTDDPARLAGVLSGVNELCRLVTAGETYAPLNPEERAWVERQTRKGDRVVPMSFGYKEGDNLVVTEGPLKGYEAKVARVDRRNCLAHLEFHVGNIRLKTSVGLVVVPRPQSA